MIEKSQLFDVVPTFSSESKEPFKLDGNYVIRFQSLMANNDNFDKIKNVLEKYRSQKQLASQGILAVYAINLRYKYNLEQRNLNYLINSNPYV